MATFTNVSAFADHVAKYGKKIESTQPRAVEAAAKVAQIAIKQAGSRFHIRGRTGKKWTLGAKVEGPYGYAGNWIAYVRADPQGFWHLVEKGAGPHMIAPRKLGARAKRNAIRRGAPIVEKGGLHGAGYGHPINRPIHHPGTGPLGHPWEIGVARARAISSKAYHRAVFSALGRAA